MKRWKQVAACLGVLLTFMTGCGQAEVPEELNSSAISVSEKGQIEAYLVEDFDKPYYDLSELTALAMEEAENFNTEKESADGETIPVKVEKVEAAGETKVKVVYRFDGWQTYTEFNESSLFFGTVEEAAAEGYLSGAVLKSVKDGTLLSEAELKQEGDRRLIITDAAANIYCPAKVTHISDSASMNEDGSVAAADAEKTVYILLK